MESQLDWNDAEEQKMDIVTMKEFEALCDKTFSIKEEKDVLKKALKGVEERLVEAQQQVIAYLEQFGKTKYLANAGNVHITERRSVRLPQGEDKKAFFDFLDSKGVLFDMVHMNSRTLQSFYKEEMNAALDAGNIDFQVPGIEEPVAVKTLTMKKAK